MSGVSWLSAPGQETKVRSASPLIMATQLPLSITGDGGVSVSMPSVANAERRKSPSGPVPNCPPNTTFMPVRLAATIMLKPPPATLA